jgi:hypothetical protein
MPYRHRQVGWVILAAIAFADILACAIVIASGVPWVALVVIGGTGIVFLLFGWLTSEVDATHLRIRFGIGVIRRTWALSNLERADIVRNPWWIGWGVRFMPGRTVFNVSGFRAVEFETADNKIYRIGTDDPKGLQSAIAERIGS